MPLPDFIAALRQKIGNDPLWLPGISAAILRFTEAAPEVLLVRQVPSGCWTLIGGCIEPGEDPDIAAAREVLEETGLTVAFDRLLWIRALDETTLHNGDIVQFLDIALVGHPLDNTIPYVADDESDGVGWFKIDSLPPLLDRHRRLVELALDETSPQAIFGQQERQLS